MFNMIQGLSSSRSSRLLKVGENLDMTMRFTLSLNSSLLLATLKTSFGYIVAFSQPKKSGVEPWA